MKPRRLGSTDLMLSPIGIGTAVMGRDPQGWGPVDDNESIAAIHAAIESGFNWIETAPWYGAGHAEEVAGRALQSSRAQMLIVGCLETPSADALGARREKVAAVLARDLEASLRRLRTDRLDVCLCRVPDAGPLLAESVEVLSTMLAQGKIRAIGPLTASAERLRAWRDAGPLHAMLAPGNLVESTAVFDVAPAALRMEAAFIAGSPLCRGLLSGRVTAMSRFNDLRARDPQFLPPRLAANVKLTEGLIAVAAQRGDSAARLALAWLLSRPGVTAAALGVRRASHVRDLASPLSPPDDSQLLEIESLLADRDRRLARGL